MKAVIVEIKESVAAVLSEDGSVSKLRNNNYVVGQEIILRNNNKFIKLAATIAASLIIFATPAWAYLTPYSYVSLDINPSFEFLINRFDRVLEVRAVNDDGEKVVEKISIATLKNKEINEAIKDVLVELKVQGYIIEGKEGGVVVATSSKKQEKSDELSAALKTTVEEEITFTADNINKDKENKEVIKQIEKADKSDEEELKTEANEEPVKLEEDKEENKEIKEAEKEEKEVIKENEKADKETEKEIKKEEKGKFSVEVIEVSQDDVDEAKEHNVTPGKLNLIGKLQDVYPKTLIFEEDQWFNKSVKEIMDAIKEYSKSNKESKDESKQEQSNKEEVKTQKPDNKSNNN